MTFGGDTMSKNIKDYRSKGLLWYIIAQIFIIVIFQNPNILKSNFNEWQKILFNIITSTVFSSVVGVLSFVFDAMFGDELKYKLLYFGTKRPGEEVFNNIKIKHSDFRYTKEKALKKYKEIYDNMPESKTDREAYENDQWYQIYTIHRNDPMIFNSHRDYLLCRDIYFATIITVILYILLVFLLNDISFSWKLLVLEAMFLISSNIATRQRGKRFVANVIAIDLQEKPENIFLSQ